MRVETLFYVSLALSVCSFLLFAGQILAAILRERRKIRNAPVAGGMADVEPHTINPVRWMEELGELAHSFAKAGPLSTSAALSITFALIALVSSGLIKVE